MRKSEARRRLREMAADLEVVTKGYLPARANYAEWTGLGYPTQSLGGSGNGHGVSNPVESVALSAVDRRQREAVAGEWSELETDLKTVSKALARMRKNINAATIKTGLRGALGCTNCDGARRSNGQPHPESFQERHAHGLCHFCYEFQDRYSVEPGPNVRLWHLDHLGQRVPYSVIRADHPLEFEKVHGAHRRQRAG